MDKTEISFQEKSRIKKPSSSRNVFRKGHAVYFTSVVSTLKRSTLVCEQNLRATSKIVFFCIFLQL